MKQNKNVILSIAMLLIVLFSAPSLHAEERPYLWEFGVQGGLGYYVGDATDHIFNDVQWAAGAQMRYKFDDRWALRVQGQGQKIAFPLLNEQGGKIDTKGSNILANIDLAAEFNFFRFGQKQYDERIKPITPYIFLGVGLSVYTGGAAAYFPFGLGMKWKFAPRWGLNVVWQQNLYFADNLENVPNYDNTFELNGSNILKNDFTSSLTVGIVFEFAQSKGNCRLCYD